MRHGKLELVATLMLIFSVTICERINSPQRDQDEENEEKFPMIIEEQNIEDSGYPVKPLDIILVVIYGIITTVGLIANGIVFFVIFARDEINRTVTALYVVQLALADTIFLISLPLFGAQKITKEWTLGEGSCVLTQTIKFFNYYASIFFLTAMSVDRYVAVAYSTKSHILRTKKRTMLACCIVWISSGLMALPVAMYSGTEVVTNETKCRLMFPGYQTYNNTEESSMDMYTSGYYYGSTSGGDKDKEYPGNEENDNFREEEAAAAPTFLCSNDRSSIIYNHWVIVNLILGFLLPFIIISASYVLILMRVYESEEKLSSVKGKQRSVTRKRVTRMVAVLVLCFGICWLPYEILLLLKINGFEVPSYKTCVNLEEFFIALGFANSALNPILYTFMGQNFKYRLYESIRRTKGSIFGSKFQSSRFSNRSNNGKKNGPRITSKKSAESVVGYHAGKTDREPNVSLFSSNRRYVVRHDLYNKLHQDAVADDVITQSNQTELTRVTNSSFSSDRL